MIYISDRTTSSTGRSHRAIYRELPYNYLQKRFICPSFIDIRSVISITIIRTKQLQRLERRVRITTPFRDCEPHCHDKHRTLKRCKTLVYVKCEN